MQCDEGLCSPRSVFAVWRGLSIMAAIAAVAGAPTAIAEERTNGAGAAAQETGASVAGAGNATRPTHRPGEARDDGRSAAGGVVGAGNTARPTHTPGQAPQQGRVTVRVGDDVTIDVQAGEEQAGQAARHNARPENNESNKVGRPEGGGKPKDNADKETPAQQVARKIIEDAAEQDEPEDDAAKLRGDEALTVQKGLNAVNENRDAAVKALDGMAPEPSLTPMDESSLSLGEGDELGDL